MIQQQFHCICIFIMWGAVVQWSEHQRLKAGGPGFTSLVAAPFFSLPASLLMYNVDG